MQGEVIILTESSTLQASHIWGFLVKVSLCSVHWMKSAQQ